MMRTARKTTCKQETTMNRVRTWATGGQWSWKESPNARHAVSFLFVPGPSAATRIGQQPEAARHHQAVAGHGQVQLIIGNEFTDLCAHRFPISIHGFTASCSVQHFRSILVRIIIIP
eukprot:4714571-Pyramimonas_sp.AAC.1